MIDDLSGFHRNLNSEELLPAGAYRRNVVIFELVSSVNCLIGCVLSERRDIIPIWIHRCGVFFEQTPVQPEWEIYIGVVQRYITQVEKHFDITSTDLDL